jgi:linker histone H1 and H5 family
MNISHLARAITSGVDEELFSLPKGPAGKVKLFKPKAISTTTKEV